MAMPWTSLPRCTQCTPRQKENARNLVVCIDGTSNLFGQNNTNVAKLFAKIDQETTIPEQPAYYSNGIGAQPNLSRIIERLERAISEKFDMAVAWNLENIVKDAYSWLSRHYEEGDQIYLFGFSRGAYQVRVLAGMIHEVGLIRTPTGAQIGRAYDCYGAIRSSNPKTWQIAREFKNTFSWKDLRVHFVGVWDTVSSVGLVRGDIFLSTSSSATHACHFRHALALDERRVKFMPEYFHEMNSPSTDGRSKYVQAVSGLTDNDTYLSNGKEKKSEIKEVWFAGSHSDVGGRNRFGKSHQAGNVSLLWMRREAAACGLRLKPTDVVWVPDDLDFGTTNPMTHAWRAMEYMPIRHQVSFTGPGENARRLHRFQPRRIIPGQKVHASVLYANSYQPTATLGEGFDIPIIQPWHEDAELDSELWETGLFDDTAAGELLDYLSTRQEIAPIFLDRLLFILRFDEGKESIRKVPGWRNKFMELIGEDYRTLPVRLLMIVAFHEASCDLKAHPDRCEPFPEWLSHDTFVEVESSLKAILATPRHRDGPRVLALLRPMTKHRILRQSFLTDQVLENLMPLFDAMVEQPTGHFGKAMDGLSCLLQCEGTRSFLIGKLGEIPEGFNVSRLAEILKTEDSGLLTSALHMMLILARIPDARPVCSPVLPRIRQLASTSDRLVGQLAVEICLTLYDETEQHSLIINTRVRANLASVLVHRRDSADDQGRPVDPGQLILSRLFGVDAVELTDAQRKLFGELKAAVEKGDARERTAATLTLLKLCETKVVRSYLRHINLLELFVKQLQRKDSALLAAYALTTCLKYTDMKGPIQDNDDLPTCIVAMLAFDYFDEAVGQVEGFQIFGDFMQHADLRKKIKNYKITEILDMKLSRGRPKEIRTSLICLEIFQSFDPNDSWIDELIESSLERLTNKVWRVQKAAITILSVLVQTERGVGTISPRIHEIVEMLLPRGYLAISESGTAAGPTSMNLDSADDGQVQNNDSSLIVPEPPSRMLGPTYALRVLVKNETLRVRVRETLQYASLKHLFLSGTLVDEKDTSPWRTWTPNRMDVIEMLDELIKVVDGELPGGLMSIRDPVLPHIMHWDRLVSMLRNNSVAAITVLPKMVGVSALAILAVVVATPIYVSLRAFDFVRRLRLRYLDRRASESSRDAAQRHHTTDEATPGSHQAEGAMTPQNVEGPSMQGS